VKIDVKRESQTILLLKEIKKTLTLKSIEDSSSASCRYEWAQVECFNLGFSREMGLRLNNS